MKRTGGWMAAAWIIVGFWLASPVQAQRGRQYTPARPTISPYFGYFQFNTTPLPNYQAFVQPQREIFSGLRTESRRIDRLEQQIRLRDTQGTSSLLRRSESDVGAPSRAATFLDLQPYYPLQDAVRTRR